ncbi:MAG: hypothetical protein FWE82_09830, partial [Defluviitaleaceae bacterium]|nr:hypothetical protein [Defluviitaleaceae bacterium]
MNDKKNIGCLKIICFFLCLIFIPIFIGALIDNDMIPIFAFVIISIYGAIILLYNMHKTKIDMENDKINMQKKYEAYLSGIILHEEGLPFPKGVCVNVYYGSKKLTFVREHQEIILELSKVESMDTVSGSDIQAQATAA